MTDFWWEIKNPAHPRHTSDVKSRHLSPAVHLLSPALVGPGIQMTGALGPDVGEAWSVS